MDYNDRKAKLIQEAYSLYKDGKGLAYLEREIKRGIRWTAKNKNRNHFDRRLSDLKFHIDLADLLRKELYGWDDRLDFYQIPESEVRENSMAVGLLVKKTKNRTGPVVRSHFGSGSNYCKYLRYFWHPTVVNILATAFFVGPSTLFTASHTLNGFDPIWHDLSFIQGFALTNDLEVSSAANSLIEFDVDKNNIIHKGSGKKGTSEDYAILRTLKPGKNHIGFPKKPPSGLIGRNVYMLGHPLGLPLKYAFNSKIISVDDHIFKAEIDAYNFNSGSPLIDSDSHELLGIFVSGEKGTRNKRGCVELIPRYSTGTWSYQSGLTISSDMISKLP